MNYEQEKMIAAIKAFHDLAVQQRNAAWQECDALRARAEQAKAERNLLSEQVALWRGRYEGALEVAEIANERAEKAEAALAEVQRHKPSLVLGRLLDVIEEPMECGHAIQMWEEDSEVCIACERDRLARILAVEHGDESQAREGWVPSMDSTRWIHTESASWVQRCVDKPGWTIGHGWSNHTVYPSALEAQEAVDTAKEKP